MQNISVQQHATPSPTRGLRRFEKDEAAALVALVSKMNVLHAEMGGRDSRPERKALLRAMKILQKCIDDLRASGAACGWPTRLAGWLGVAVDLDVGRVDVYSSCGVIGRTVSIPVGGIDYYAWFDGGGGNQSITGNFGASSFNCTPPAGYNPGF